MEGKKIGTLTVVGKTSCALARFSFGEFGPRLCSKRFGTHDCDCLQCLPLVSLANAYYKRQSVLRQFIERAVSNTGDGPTPVSCMHCELVFLYSNSDPMATAAIIASQVMRICSVVGMAERALRPRVDWPQTFDALLCSGCRERVCNGRPLCYYCLGPVEESIGDSGRRNVCHGNLHMIALARGYVSLGPSPSSPPPPPLPPPSLLPLQAGIGTPQVRYYQPQQQQQQQQHDTDDMDLYLV